jgi:dTDP-4-dehydrorhamnose 3,5-epimerase
MITVNNLPLQDARVITLQRHTDDRGWFTETFRQTWIDDHLNWQEFIFDYSSYSVNAGTIRGLHAQTDKAPQAKLIHVLNGSILDVLVDARIDSPTYGQSCSVLLTKDDPKLVFIPRGFYHGFMTLEPNTYVNYKVDNYHNSESERGIAWNDPILQIDWPIKDNLTISQRDQGHPGWDLAYKFEGTL